MTLWATGARADRFTVSIGDLPGLVLPDSAEGAASLSGSIGARPASSGSVSRLLPTAPAAVPARIAVPATVDLAGLKVPGTPLPRTRGAPTVSPLSGPPPPPMAPAFAEALRTRYQFSAEPEMLIAWGFYQKERAGLREPTRIANAVIKAVLAMDRTPTGGSTARPQGLKPTATAGSVRNADGLVVRSRPWGESTGATLSQGTSLTIVPPSDGVWYRIQSGGTTAWVPGIWLELR